jgi:GT2 family glycosyltransferase
MIDIVMPCWTGKEIPKAVYDCVGSIIKNTKDFNFIIVGSDESQPKNINRGLDKCTSKYICVIDDDIVVHHGWMEKMIQALEADPKIGIISPSQGGKYSEHFGYLSHDKDEVVDVISAIGACMVFRNIGLRWSEDFKAGYWCDTDFARQYKEKGYRICMHGGAKIDHELTTTLGNSDFANEMMIDGEQVYFNHWGDLNP